MPSQAQERARGADGCAKGGSRGGGGPRRVAGARAGAYWTLAPTVASQPPLITSAIASCSSSVGKTAAS